MGCLQLNAVFWKKVDDEQPEDAVVTVEDGEVCYITSPDGLEVRLLIHEVVEIARFVADEVEAFDQSREAENGAETETLATDEIPF